MEGLNKTRTALCTILTVVMLYSVISHPKISTASDGTSQLVRKFYPSDDAVVYENAPNQNFGSNGVIGVNYRNGFRDRSFIMFDLSSIPFGSTIVSATLNIYMYDPPNVSRTLECYEVDEIWREYRITWNNQPSATLLVASVQTGTKAKTLSLNVKDSIIKFASGDTVGYVPNCGWMLKDSAEGSGASDDPFWICSKEHTDTSKRPYLEVKYYPPHLELSISSSSVQAGNWVGMTVYRKTYSGALIYNRNLKVKLFSNSTSANKFSLVPGGDAITELTIPNDLGYMDFYYYDDGAGSWGITVVTGDYADYIGDSKSLRITPGPLDYFAFSPVSSPRIVAVPFTITITAYDIYGNVKTDYTGINSLSDTTETISPTITGAFVNGRWTGKVTINETGDNIRIMTSGAGKRGESSLFNVSKGLPVKIVLGPSSFNMAAGVAYSYLTISLRDVNNFETASASDILIGLSTTSPSGEFRQLGTTDIINFVNIPAGESSVKVDYYDSILGNKTLTAWGVGLLSGTATAVVILDTTPPVTAVTVSSPSHQNNTKLYVSNTTFFTFSATDDLHGIIEIKYKVNNDSWSIYNAPFKVSAHYDGLCTLRYYSIDKAGNREYEKELVVIFDNTPPNVEDAYPTGSLFASSSSVVFSVKVTDNGSGVKEVELVVDGASRGVMAKGKTKYDKKVNLSEGVHSWSVKAVDNVNNSATYAYSFTLMLDTVLPRISVLSAPSNPVFGESTIVTCRVSDEPSGVKRVFIYYSTDKGSSWMSIPMTLEGGFYSASIPSQIFFTEVQYYVEAIDNAGNRSQTTVSRYLVDMPSYVYFAIVALIAILITVLSFRRRRKTAPQRTGTS